MRDWSIYEWLRDHGQVIGAALASFVAALMALLGWHVKREQKWRDHVELRLETIIPRAEVVRMIDRAAADRNAQITAILGRMDRESARIDRQFRDQAEARTENLKLVRKDISQLSDRVEMLIRRELGSNHRDGPQG